MVDNPNSVLQGDLHTSGHGVQQRVALQITTAHTPIPAGGIADMAPAVRV
jgi:hypothetical protein